jgi:TM2 domain-containing membrane protein YozV
MMNGDVGKGVGILLGYVISIPLCFVGIGFLGVLGFWIWGMVDGYKGAQRWNLRHGIVS